MQLSYCQQFVKHAQTDLLLGPQDLDATVVAKASLLACRRKLLHVPLKSGHLGEDLALLNFVEVRAERQATQDLTLCLLHHFHVSLEDLQNKLLIPLHIARLESCSPLRDLLCSIELAFACQDLNNLNNFQYITHLKIVTVFLNWLQLLDQLIEDLSYAISSLALLLLLTQRKC